MDEKNKKAVWIKFAVMAMVVIGAYIVFLRRPHYGSVGNRKTAN